MIVVEMIRKTDTINWNTIRGFLNPPLLAEKEKPDLSTLISLILLNTKEGYAPEAKLISAKSSSSTPTAIGFNNNAGLKGRSISWSKKGKMNMANTIAKIKAMKFNNRDSPINCKKSWPLAEPNTLRIAISEVLLIDSAV